jgi:uroporphyrinogen-III synthase
MTASGRLAGKTIVVTRPAAQAGALAAAIEAAGGRALIFPLLEISPPADAQPLHAAAQHLADYALAIFISPNAVDFSLPAILRNGPWPAHVLPAGIGPGTAKALAAQGIRHCLLPAERFDSEGLLAEAALSPAQVQGRRIAIFRGNGGRELLADTLRQRGALVDCITSYQRSGPPLAAKILTTAWAAGQLDALTLSSSEALRYLIDRLDAPARERLAETPIFVPHPRIAAAAAALGLQKIILTEAADAGILTGLLAYNYPA